MKCSFKEFVFEMSLYYGLIALALPLIYAVTNQLSFMSVFGTEWLAVTLFLSPIIVLLSVIRYSFHKLRETSH